VNTSDRGARARAAATATSSAANTSGGGASVKTAAVAVSAKKDNVVYWKTNRKINDDLCEHKRQRSQCRDCGGSGLYQHQRQRGQYRDCNKLKMKP